MPACHACPACVHALHTTQALDVLHALDAHIAYVACMGCLPTCPVRLPCPLGPSLPVWPTQTTRPHMTHVTFLQVFCNARSNYHVTVFHTSHPTDQRPSPRAPGGGVAAGGAPSRAPTAAELAEEADVVAACVARVASPRLVLDRVVMAASGTLLLT
eukprot:359619-Chlamydomonas_euryale.AAC.8